MPARIKKERGDVTLVAVLAGMVILTAGIFAGNKLVEVGSRFFPKAEEIETQSYRKPTRTPTPTATLMPSPTCVPPPPPCPSGAWGNTCPEIYLPPGGWICPLTPTPTMCAMPTPPLCENGTLKASSETQTWGVCPPKYICVTPTPSCMPMPEECNVNQGAGTPTIACSAPPGGWCPVTPTKVPITTVVCTKRKYGDANCDGKISGVDYSVWLNSQCYQNTGKTCLDLRADFNQDNYIDGLDFVRWLNNRGK